jgi:hypothetical protein
MFKKLQTSFFHKFILLHPLKSNSVLKTIFVFFMLVVMKESGVEDLVKTAESILDPFLSLWPALFLLTQSHLCPSLWLLLFALTSRRTYHF